MIRRSFASLLREGVDVRWPGRGERVSVGGLPGAGPSLLAATLESDTEAFVVLVADTPGEAELLYADLETLEGSERSRYLPQR